jgi:F-type H+-transporting ATPase subunit b
MELTFDVTSKLFPNPLTMLVQLLATAVLFYFLIKLLWKPAKDYINKRQSFITDQVTSAQQMLSDAKAMEENAKLLLKSANQESLSIIEKGKLEGNITKDLIIKEARREADLKLEHARREIEQDKAALKDKIHQEIIDVALLASEQLLSKHATSELDRYEVEQFIKEVGRS